MSGYSIGRHANTRGRVAVSLPCVACGARVRAYRVPAATSPQPVVAACPSCRRGDAVAPLVAALQARVAPELAAWDAAHPYQPAGYVPGALTAHQIAREAHRQAVWARAIADSLAERQGDAVLAGG